MANRLKEDERNERIIRGLLKLPGNRRCINCNSLGPQYVCTNFWTFICTTCSGIHREYTHRVKSVSMAKFTSQEVAALQGGGNEIAREVYLKEWDPQRHPIPDSSNVERLRDFIRHVYVDRRYTGERGMPPRTKMGEKESSYESRSADTSRGGSRSPSYGDDKVYRSNYDERRSPGYDQESRYANNYKKSPVRFEVVDDRQRDRFGNERKFEDRRYSKGESKSEGRSPNRQMDTSSPPMIRPVRDILGENVPPLRIGEPPKANSGKAADGLTQTQRTTSSSSLGSKDGASVEPKAENSVSLIDFDTEPAPSAATSGSPKQPTTSPVAQSVAQPSPSVDGDNWASFGFASQAPSQPQAPSNANTLESLFSQLSAPAPATAPPSNMSTTSAGVPTSTVGNISTVAITSGSPTSIVNTSTFPFGVTSAAAPSGNIQSSAISSSVSPPAPGDMMSALGFGGGNNNEGGWANVQQNNPSSFTSNGSQSTAPQFTTGVQASSNQVSSSPFTHSSQAESKQTQDRPATLPAHQEAKMNERKALPEDLFAATYSLAPVSVPGWHTGPTSGMGYGMQYPVAAPMQNFPQSSRPTNPFDLTSESTMVHAPSLPSLSSLQGALPNVRASGLVRSSSFGNPSQQWMPPNSQFYTSQMHSPPYPSTMHSPPYPSTMHSPPYPSTMHSPPYPSTMNPSAYMGQVSSTMTPQRKQGSGSMGFEPSFGNLSADQQQPQSARYSLPVTPNTFSPHSGNPFG